MGGRGGGGAGVGRTGLNWYLNTSLLVVICCVLKASGSMYPGVPTSCCFSLLSPTLLAFNIPKPAILAFRTHIKAGRPEPESRTNAWLQAECQSLAWSGSHTQTMFHLIFETGVHTMSQQTLPYTYASVMKIRVDSHVAWTQTEFPF